MNQGRNFSIATETSKRVEKFEEADVFARDEETVVVVRTKSATHLQKKSLRRDLERYDEAKGPIAKAINKHYGRSFKPKIIWIFATENIIWSRPDRERADQNKIHAVTEREVRYYQQIADHLGMAARYQFLAEFLKNQKIPELKDQIVPAIRGKLGGRKFYSFVCTPRHLLKIAFVNHRSLSDPDGAPAYQRLIDRSRMKKIGSFLEEGGFFPTNVLVNFTNNIRFDVVKKASGVDISYGNLHLPDKYQSTWIIDGQHRLYGYAHLEDKYLDQNLAVIAFEKLPKEEEARLFVTINHEQRTVPKTLLEDLEGELNWGSTIPTERIGAMSARLVGVLNLDVGEAFYGRVTAQGIKTTDHTCLTVPAFKDGLRRSGLLGRALVKPKNYEMGPLSGKSDAATLDRARSAINLFFNALRESNNSQWEKGRGGYLCTNVSIQAYLMLFSSLIRYMEANKGFNAAELEAQEIVLEVQEYFQPVLDFVTSARDDVLERSFKVQFGSGGPKEFYFRLCKIVKSEYSDFLPEGFEEWESEQSEERIDLADRRLKEVQMRLQKYIFDELRKIYGEENDAYWDKGVTDKRIKTGAYEKSLDVNTEDRLQLEHYLDFIDYKKIIESKPLWERFKPVFNIPLPGDKGVAKNTKWMTRVNELRRIPAHPTDKRRYRNEDFDFIDFIHEEVDRRID